MKTVVKIAGLIIIMGLFSSFLSGCAKKIGDSVGQGSGITEAELTGSALEIGYPLSEYRLVRVQLEYTSNELWGEDYVFDAVPGMLKKAETFNMDLNDYDVVTDKPLTDEQWQALEAYLRGVQDKLHFIRTETIKENTADKEKTDLTDSNGEMLEVLDGSSGGFLITVEKDGEQIIVRYAHGSYETVALIEMLTEYAKN